MSLSNRWIVVFENYSFSMCIPQELRMITFTDLGFPSETKEVPKITEKCMTAHHDSDSRNRFMCSFSKMVVKTNGQMRVYACTLVDDDADYDQGSDLTTALQQRVMLKHHRCFSCFSQATSCSEL